MVQRKGLQTFSLKGLIASTLGFAGLEFLSQLLDFAVVVRK